MANAVYGDWTIDLKSVTADDVAMFVSVANTVSKVSRNDRTDLVDAFQRIVDVTKHNTKLELEGKRNKVSVPVPVTTEAFHANIVGGKKTAFLPNLPHPEVVRLGEHNEFAYVPLRSCVEDLLSSAGTCNGSKDADCLPFENSKHAKEIFRRAKEMYPECPVVSLLLLVWQDGFEINYSIKQDKDPAWVKVITLLYYAF